VQNDATKSDNYDTVKLKIGKRGNGTVEKVSASGDKIDYRSNSWKYTVNFRNTGNSIVTKAVMVDTLSSLLPLQQVVLKSFYPTKATYSIQQGRILVVNFDPANLTSAEVNPKSSSGWVEYQVDLYDKIPLNTVIPNTAMVSFDSRWVAFSNACGVTIYDASASARNLQKNALTVYPNPVSQMLNVQWKQQEIGTTYKLINHLGNVVLQGQISDSQTQVDVSRLTSGIYMLSTSLSTTKILVAH
jgi:hypothetical protein